MTALAVSTGLFIGSVPSIGSNDSLDALLSDCGLNRRDVIIQIVRNFKKEKIGYAVAVRTVDGIRIGWSKRHNPVLENKKIDNGKIIKIRRKEEWNGLAGIRVALHRAGIEIDAGEQVGKMNPPDIFRNYIQSVAYRAVLAWRDYRFI